jgi:polysaccharide export outer membrane protein
MLKRFGIIFNYRWPIVMALLFAWSAVGAQEHIIEKSDLLSITFLQQPTMNAQARVQEDGMIELPVVGRVGAAGKTAVKLEQEIIRQFSFYNSKITQVSVTVTEYGSNKVYINGQVLAPGKYSFAVMPTIWQAIMEAGGPLESANLSEVTLVRGSGPESGKILTIDLADALNRNAINELPKMTPGDIVYVTAVATTGLGTLGRSPLQRSTQVFIYGEVLRPGAYQYEANTNVLQALINAGGPTANADMEHVRLIWLAPHSTQVAQIDLARSSKEPNAPPLLLQGGDTIFIPKRNSILQAIGGTFSRAYQVGLAALASVLVYRYVR